MAVLYNTPSLWSSLGGWVPLWLKRDFQKSGCFSLLHLSGPSIPSDPFQYRLHASFLVFSSIVGRSFTVVFLGAIELWAPCLPGGALPTGLSFGQPRFEFLNNELSFAFYFVLSSFSSASGHLKVLRREAISCWLLLHCFGERIGGKYNWSKVVCIIACDLFRPTYYPLLADTRQKETSQGEVPAV